MRTSVEESLEQRFGTVEEAAAPIDFAPRQIILADLAAHPLATSACLLVTDILALAIARWVGYTVWLQFNPQVLQENHFEFWTSLLLYLMVYAAHGMYSAAGISPVEELRRAVQGTVFVALMLAAVSFVSKEEAHSRGLLIISSLVMAFLIPW